MQCAHDVARKYLGSKAQRQKNTHDLKVAFKTYKAGDVVWYLHEWRKPGITHKLEKLYDGPFLIKKKMSEVNFLLQMGRVGQEKVVHHDKLKLFEGRDLPRWIKVAREKLQQ